jgi:immune inhibitor A
MTPRNRPLLIIGIGLLFVLCCYCAAVTGIGAWLIAQPAEPPVVVVTRVVTVQATRQPVRTLLPSQTAEPTAAPVATAAARPTAEAVRTPGATAAGSQNADDADNLLIQTEMPPADPRLLAMRFRDDATEIPEVVNAEPPVYKVGDKAQFWVNNSDTQRHQRITAQLMVVTDHLAMWVQEGVRYNQRDLEASANRFEEQTYPTNREFFGSEWTPGVDNDPRLHILHSRGLGEMVAGYYSSADEYSRLVNEYSNEREMFYISAEPGNAKPNSAFYDGTLAHEFQHMIHWANDRNETSWVNEGMSELASYLNGFDPGGADLAYAEQPDTQLTAWADPSEGNAEHYGASYLFMSYFLDRFGDDLTKAVVASPLNGIAGFDAALAGAGRDERFEDVFADWVIANYLDAPEADEEGRYGYADIDTFPMSVADTYRTYPAADEARVSQYGVDYIRLRGGRPMTVRFQGATRAQLVAAEPQGTFSWWSNRGDQSNSTLTRSVDLREVDKATLTFSAWYDIEEGWDYAYVSVSVDNGQKWQILPGRHTTERNPVGNAFGSGWTGISGGGDDAEWVEEEVDLTSFAGQQILLRFEMVTDDAVNEPGLLIDDVAIREAGFEDDGESGASGWTSEGWLLTDNSVRQRWLVQVLQIADSQVTVRRMTVGEDGRGELSIPQLDGGEAVVIVSGLAPVTTETATYSYEVTLD